MDNPTGREARSINHPVKSLIAQGRQHAQEVVRKLGHVEPFEETMFQIFDTLEAMCFGRETSKEIVMPVKQPQPRPIGELLAMPAQNGTIEFMGQPVRFVEKDGEPWFVAKDVCDALGIAHVGSAMRNIDDDWKGVHKTHTLGGQQKLSIICEQACYQIAFRSEKPEAKQFNRWVADLVKRFRKADPMLAESIIDRTKSPDDLKRLEKRARLRSGYLPLTQEIKDHGGRWCYGAVANHINLAATGKKAAELRAERGVKQTRDGLTGVEMSWADIAQDAMKAEIEKQNPRGDYAILNETDKVRQKIAAARNHVYGVLA